MKHELNACILIPTLALKQAVEMKHELSACILQCMHSVRVSSQLLQCMHSVRVSSQLLVSGVFIAVPANSEIFKFFPTLVHMYACIKVPQTQQQELHKQLSRFIIILKVLKCLPFEAILSISLSKYKSW